MILTSFVTAGVLLAQSPELQDPAYRLAHLAPLGAKPVATAVTSDHEPLRLEVKFVDGAGVRLIDGRFLANSDEVGELDQLLEGMGAVRSRTFQQSDDWLQTFRAQGEARSGRPLHDLSLFYSVRLNEGDDVSEICDRLNAFGCVELAYPVGKGGDPVVTAPAALGTTPDFEGFQDYREAAPLGVDADYGNTFAGGTGLGTTIADTETGWTDDHEDIAHKALGNFVGFTNAPYPWNHGTAVVGELVGENNESGVLGICYSSDIVLSSHQSLAGTNIPGGVMNAIAAVGPGDMVLLEVQCFGGPPGPFPCEYVPSTFAAIEAATANGIHVFAAAGNGNNNLDSGAYGGLFDLNVRDSGAVMVGASNGASLDKASFSNFGTRLDAHGWGFNVATAGYGDLQGGPATEQYTLTFSGTSSASPIVVGAGSILNSIHLSVLGVPLEPLVLRELLTATGTPQGSGGQIGPRPDVRAAIEELNLPRIEVAGDFVPGGDVTVTQRGPVGAVYALTASAELRATPLLSPFGEFFLADPWQRVNAGVLDGSGSATFDFTIPNDPILVGTTYRYLQGWMRFPGTGSGSFANFLPVDVE